MAHTIPSTGVEHLCNVFAGAPTGISQTSLYQGIQCRLVKRVALRLPDRGLVRHQTTGAELLQDDVVQAGQAARCVHIFQAHQPPSGVGTGVH